MGSDKMMNSGTGVEISGPAGGDAGRHDFDTFFQDDVKPWRVLGQRLITEVYLCNPTALITVVTVTLRGGHNWTNADPAFASSL